MEDPTLGWQFHERVVATRKGRVEARHCTGIGEDRKREGGGRGGGTVYPPRSGFLSQAGGLLIAVHRSQDVVP